MSDYQPGYQAPPPPPGYGGPGGFGGPAPYAAPADAVPAASDPDYPVTAGLNAPLKVARWRVIGNPIMAIPHVIFLYILNIVSEVLTLVAWFVIVFTGRLPDGMGTFLAGIHRYQWRVLSFYLFLREPYPAFGIPSGYADPGDDPAWLQFTPPQQYSRLAVIFRIILAIPQMLFAIVLAVAMYVAVIIGFFAVLITGAWPAGLRNFVLNVQFWGLRFSAWYLLLADPYPPFKIG
ncbi:MAG TPA: DUF4389 domain-containing protein [Acidimicrobiales bacterium]|jgi:hypothetical protein|nr:DUF4389 domain-containing protein [Acidimicrobiales bacterium]